MTDAGGVPARPPFKLKLWHVIAGAVLLVAWLYDSHRPEDNSTRAHCERAWDENKATVDLSISRSQYIDNCIEAQDFIEELRRRSSER